MLLIGNAPSNLSLLVVGGSPWGVKKLGGSAKKGAEPFSFAPFSDIEKI